MSFEDTIINLPVDNKCTVFETNETDGMGKMTLYKAFDGVSIIFNDFHINTIKSEFIPKDNMLCIDYCCVGRIEQEMGNEVYTYIKADDIKLDNRHKHNTNFYFPLSHYHGITIAFEVEKAEKSILSMLPDFPVSINKLKEKYCEIQSIFIIRSNDTVKQLFSQLYEIPQKNKNYFFKIKIIELLLYLDSLDLSENMQEKNYFSKSHVEKVKDIHKLITENIDKHYTLNFLSDEFDISLTSMKNCFKGIYGEPIFTYIRKYRMNKAAILLTTTDKSVVDISNEVGYQSPSKFSAAFKDEMATLPLEYRKKKIGIDSYKK